MRFIVKGELGSSKRAELIHIHFDYFRFKVGQKQCGALSSCCSVPCSLMRSFIKQLFISVTVSDFLTEVYCFEIKKGGIGSKGNGEGLAFFPK